MTYSHLWLEYRKIESDIKEIEVKGEFDENKCAITAVSELIEGLMEMLPDAKICINKPADISDPYRVSVKLSSELSEEEYSLNCTKKRAVITGGSGKGVLYGVFAYLRKAACKNAIPICKETVKPANPLRMLNHWDNPDGSIERGYSGRSFFLENDRILSDNRVKFFARAIASVGINAVVINNVNVKGAACRYITEEYYEELSGLTDIFLKYGISVYLSADFAAPIDIGGLTTADPLDKGVAAWWKKCCKSLFENVPNLGGFLIKADSEGRPGPFTYDRTHADGANMLAKAVKPYGGRIIWRCFVYNCQQDWRERKTDRARAAYDNFLPLDGKFEKNVILQVKNGPMDFQVREPVHPLFGAMKNTNLMLEVQIAQEYTGQQRHVCFLPVMFREVLDHRTYCSDKNDTVADIISSKGANCGIAAVSNTGNDFNWTGSDLANANLYGFGRMAFEKDISPEQIAREWCAMTLGNDSEVIDTVTDILMNSHKAYENYTAPLGLGWLCRPETHYGPSPIGYEYDRWGTYNYADRDGVGVDRSEKGTGYAQLYAPKLAKLYGDVKKCPDELLLFFCHVPYDHVLKSGKTVIQHIYDSHFEGYETAEDFAKRWKKLRGKIDKRIYENGVERFEMQLESAREWRDIINSFFFRLSGVPDEKGRPMY